MKTSTGIEEINHIRKEQFEKFGLQQGMRNINGEGILAGLTKVSNCYGRRGIPCEGHISYRNIELFELINMNYRYEDVAYLLLYGKLPREYEKEKFRKQINDVIDVKGHGLYSITCSMKNGNIMNFLARTVLALYELDEDPDNVAVNNVLRQVIELIGLIGVAAVQIYKRTENYDKEEIVKKEGMSLAEYILCLLKGERNYTYNDCDALNKLMILHAELGAGNNSTFTTRIISSTGSDTYAAIAAAICSIKGYRHGGASEKAYLMLKEMKNELGEDTDEVLMKRYIMSILNKEKCDRSGLIYGIGHAVFTLSDPRAVIMRDIAKVLARQKGREKEFELYSLFEKIAPKAIGEYKMIDRPICANVDFYSGFIYNMIGIPKQLITPMFVSSRIAGWGAHRIEELCNFPKIYHPSYKYVY